MGRDTKGRDQRSWNAKWGSQGPVGDCDKGLRVGLVPTLSGLGCERHKILRTDSWTGVREEGGVEGRCRKRARNAGQEGRRDKDTTSIGQVCMSGDDRAERDCQGKPRDSLAGFGASRFSKSREDPELIISNAAIDNRARSFHSDENTPPPFGPKNCREGQRGQASLLSYPSLFRSSEPLPPAQRPVNKWNSRHVQSLSPVQY